MPQVLIIEDDPNDAFFIRRAFELSGVSHQPHVCANIHDAKRYLEGTDEFADRQRFPFPSMMIVDIKMLGGSGFDLLRWIRDHPHLTVIPTMIMSSSSRPEDVKLAYCLGANAYMCKPIDQQKFKEVFGALLRFWSHCEVPETGGPTCEELEARG
jgi:DNA-binding response OmpR family regulator